MTAAITGTLTTPDGWPVGGGMLTVVDGAGVQRGRAAGWCAAAALIGSRKKVATLVAAAGR